MDMEIVFPGGKQVEARYKGFRIKTDQGKGAGGEGSAPTPFDLFLASIGTCAGFYVLQFCQERGVSTEQMTLVLRTEKDPASKMISKIMVEIQPPPGLEEKYEEALAKSAELCAVKKHILKAPEFEIYTKRTGK